MGVQRLTNAQKRALDDLIDSGLSVKDYSGLEFPDLVALMRKRLRMSQKTLAERAGMPQSYIGKIESGKISPSLKTAERIFEAMECKLMCLPIPLRAAEYVIESQALKAAESRVEYVVGTMALEDQRPDEAMQKRLIEEEKQRLIQEESSSIWEVE